MFVATVYKFHEDTFPLSHKPEGEYASFVGMTEDQAITNALRAVQRWEAGSISPSTGKFKVYGPYQILVSKVTKEVKRFDYKLVEATI